MVSPDVFLNKHKTSGEQFYLNYTMGIGVHRNISQRAELFTGVNYAQKHLTDWTGPGPIIVCKTSGEGTSGLTGFAPMPVHVKRVSIEVPLMIRYRFLKKRLTPHADAGFTVMAQTFSLSGWWAHAHMQLGAGVNYDISKHINLSFTPTLRTMLFGSGMAEPVSIGMIAAGSYRFSRRRS